MKVSNLKMIALTLAFLVSVVAYADEKKWYLVANNSERLLMENVEMLVAVDNESFFSVLGRDGQVLLENVRIVTFEQSSSADIKSATMSNDGEHMLKSIVNNELTLIGATGSIKVCSVSGKTVMTASATGAETHLDVHRLPAGIYVVKCGDNSFKFTKK